MSPATTARLVLIAAAIYDGLLGSLFLFSAPRAFALAGIPAPSHFGYAHFAAALLLIFALMFLAAAIQPAGNRNLIAFGMLLKIAYISVVAFHLTQGSVPAAFLIFAALDAAWLLAFIWIFYLLSRKPKPATAPATEAPSKLA